MEKAITGAFRRKHRLFAVGSIDKHIFNTTVEDAAEVVQRGGRDVAPLLERIECPAAERVVFDERVSGYALAPHGLPKGLVRDNKDHLPCGLYYICANRA